MSHIKLYEEVIQEFELHQMLVQQTDCLPDEMRTKPGVAVLAWASELRLHDAGKDGGDGWADLVTVDELGQTWIIEVKLSTSAELNVNVWNQVLRYRNAAGRMSWGDLQNYVDRFLDGMGRVKPVSEEFHDKKNIIDVIEEWQKSLGRKLMTSEEVVCSIANSLKKGTVGLAVVADGYRESVVKGVDGIQHDGPLAYLTVDPSLGKLRIASKFIKPGNNISGIASGIAVDEIFYKYKSKKKTKLSPSLLEEGLNPAGLAIWRQIIRPALIDLGWDGVSIAHKAEKGMTLNVNYKGQPAAIVRIGFSDTDAKGVDRKFKIAGTFGLRVDFMPWYIKAKFARSDISKENIEEFAGKLYKLGWRGTGKARKTAGIASVPEDVYKKWACMRYCPSSYVKDFLGRDDDPDKIEAFFREMKAFCRGSS